MGAIVTLLVYKYRAMLTCYECMCTNRIRILLTRKSGTMGVIITIFVGKYRATLT